jgi:hypothetical protein
MTGAIRQIVLRLRAPEGTDPDRLDQLTQGLRQQLLALELRDARPLLATEAPEGTRAVGAEVVGALVLSLACSPELLSGVVTTIQAWLSRLRSTSVRMELDGDLIEVTAVSSAEQRRLIQLWIDHHTDQ